MSTRRRQSGLSLIELMIALTIGLVLLGGLTYLFVNSSNSQRVGQQVAQQNGNAQYAMDVLTQDLHLAGYYGQYGAYASGTTLPDPCLTDSADLYNAINFPVQGFTDQETPSAPGIVPAGYPSLTGTTCGTLLPNNNLMPGSDILVIRHVDTNPLNVGDNSVSGQVYLQTDPLGAAMQTGDGSAITSTGTATGGTATITYRSSSGALIAGPINQYYVDIYFVAPCSVPADGSNICTGATDDQGHPIPTLKLLQLGLDGSGNLAFNTITIAEGIQAMKLEYGIDTTPASTNSITGHVGDGVPDCYIPNSATASLTASNFTNAVAVKVFLISRNTTTTKNFTDNKYYPVATSGTAAACGGTLGTGLVYGSYGDGYMRHAYESLVRLTNLAGRREIPGGD